MDNNLLVQLASLGPGIANALKGNGDATASFMEGYQKTMQQMDEQRRRDALLGLQTQDRETAAQDRQQQMTRQEAEDRFRHEDRQRLRGIQEMQIPGQLAEAGASADSPDDAQRLIESLMPRLMETFGQGAMAYGQPAVQMAQQTITGRQKKQVEAFVDAAVKTAFVADNPDADPEITSLPAHIAKALGKPSARLSELQTFAQLPVGKPAGKTRIPPAAGSMEEFSDPSITPERKAAILADRKAYMQSDDRAPRVTVNTGDAGGLNPNQQALMTERLAKVWNDVTASAREVRRQFGLMEVGLKRFRDGDKLGGSQAVLVTFQKILDPASVVRESEYARSAQGLSLLARLEGYKDRLVAGGAGVPDAELAEMVETGRQMLEGMQSYSTTQRSRLEAMAKNYKIDPVLVFGVEAPAGGGGGGEIIVTAPDGSKHPFATQAQADAFKALAGIK